MVRKRNFALISQMCRSLEFSKGGKNYRKTDFFLLKNLWKLLDPRILHIFEISAKFRFF
jgi:hypothetical protein